MSIPQIEQFIDMLLAIPANNYDNAFSYVMSEWTKQQGNLGAALFGFSCLQAMLSPIWHWIFSF